MEGKPKIFYRIKALFFTGAIAAATLRGCTYGPPPAVVQPDIQNTLNQESQELINKFNLSISENEAEVEQKNV